jgi:hypothetical protein
MNKVGPLREYSISKGQIGYHYRELYNPIKSWWQNKQWDLEWVNNVSLIWKKGL